MAVVVNVDIIYNINCVAARKKKEYRGKLRFNQS